ncbi:MAG: rod shape-determining protein MreD [Bacteroidales bacterium]|uniref:rod shape-determining protein MreD n=1 Tax=Sodaliphilus sp. TaxID=2815818 RepID=UPI001B757B5B|nr:rod shape-determining protein MreD [Candidatus Sodaliphilus limicaballi]
MNKSIIQFAILFVVLTLLQVVCNKVILFDVATPIIFIYLLFRFPVNMHKALLFSLAFAMGLIIDIFGNTSGMHAMACTLTAALRLPVINLYITREDEMNSPLPSIDSMGFTCYFKYVSTMALIYCTILFFIQAFTLNDLLLTVERIGASSVLSILLLLGIDSLVSTRREKKL